MESRTGLQFAWNKKCSLPAVIPQLLGFEESCVGSPGVWPMTSADTLSSYYVPLSPQDAMG